MDFRDGHDKAMFESPNWQVQDIFKRAEADLMASTAFSNGQMAVLRTMLTNLAVAVGTLYYTTPQHHHE